MNTISKTWFKIQRDLFPFLEEEIGALTDEYKKLAAILELVRIEDYISKNDFAWGRPLKNRDAIARAYIAKIVLKITYTKQLVARLKTEKQLRLICGWEPGAKVPSESSFSRAFSDFTKSCLPEKVHETLIKNTYSNKIICHLTKDSMPIKAREKGFKKKGSLKERRKQLNAQHKEEKKNGISRKQKQLKQDLPTMLGELPKICDFGSKKSSQGHAKTWKGFKIHIASDDSGIPIAAIVTSASLNDSEVAIPLAEKLKNITIFYDLMDAAYDAPEIREHSLSLGHIPIIDKHSRSKKQKAEKLLEKERKRTLNFATAEDVRYRERFPKERCNALLKEYYGASNIQYKGYKKVTCHLMFGLLTLTALMLLNCVT
jgi:hypothetical protein